VTAASVTLELLWWPQTHATLAARSCREIDCPCNDLRLSNAPMHSKAARAHGQSPCAAMTAAAASEGPHDACVHLPPTRILWRRHVEGALKGVPHNVGDVTVWIHSSTIGIEVKCFGGMRRVSRILVWGPEPHDVGTPPPVVATAVMGMFVAKLRAYEPALVDLIRTVSLSQT
jgi:hypothetical protein